MFKEWNFYSNSIADLLINISIIYKMLIYIYITFHLMEIWNVYNSINKPQLTFIFILISRLFKSISRIYYTIYSILDGLDLNEVIFSNCTDRRNILHLNFFQAKSIYVYVADKKMITLVW